jgi:hypothetical protein
MDVTPPLEAGTAGAQPVPTPGGAPDWVGEMWRKYSGRIRDYFVQTAALCRRPASFMEEWVTGQREMLNPLRFMGIGFLISLGVHFLKERGVAGAAGPGSTAGFILTHPALLQLTVLLVAIPTHGVMRLSGSRTPLRATLAASIFASLGPNLVLSTAAFLASALIQLFAGTPATIPVPAEQQATTELVLGSTANSWPYLLCYILQLVYSARTLTGVHRARWWWAVPALFVSALAANALLIMVTFILVQLGLLDATQVLKAFQSTSGT